VNSELSEYLPILNSHVAGRLNGLNSPVYINGVNSIRTRLKNLVGISAALISRLFIKKETFTEQNIEFLKYDLACIGGSIYRNSHYCRSLPKDKFNILFPLHYYPEAVLQTWSSYTRQAEVIENLLDHLPLNCNLIIKEHPQQVGATSLSEYRDIINNKNVLTIRGDTSATSLINDVACVITIGSTLAIDFAAVGIPAAILGRPHYLCAPGMTGFERVDNSMHNWIAENIGREIRTPAVNIDFLKWYSEFLSKHSIPGTIIPGHTRIEAKDIFNLIENNL
jgi:hypothetical protein